MMGRKKKMETVPLDKPVEMVPDEDRLAMYQEFQVEEMGAKPIETPVVTEEAPVTSEESAEKLETQPEPAVTETKVEEIQPVQVEETHKTEEKTVPLAALHEERSKHKDTKRKIAELEAKIDQLLTNKPEKPSPSAEDEEITDYDREIKTLRAKTRQYESEIESLKREFFGDRQKREQDSIANQVMSVSSELEKEGMPGFVELEPLVASEIARLWSEDADNQLVYPNNPSGWKKVYKDVIFPRFRKIVGSSPTAILHEKLEAKKEATTIRTPGTSGKEPGTSSKPSWTYDDYMKERGYER
jgi:hypothetical protein